ncbi:porin [Paraherbaspirillum soli]|uniref:Porin n=1 Tax=Paraherbaspirillum soli TaxID=631222 RepID=A0ABW0M522_9BURK
MRKRLITSSLFATLATLTAVSHAQIGSITVYGVLDTSIEHSSNANADKQGIIRLHSGAVNGSRIGFRGTEDLGGGLTAFFQLENGFRSNDGRLVQAEHLFNRRSLVGLEGRFGRIEVGRTYTTVDNFIAAFEPAGYSWLGTGAAMDKRKDGMWFHSPNLVKYEVKFGNVKLGASHGLGEVAGSYGSDAKSALGIGYDKGPFGIAATIDRVNGISVDNGAYDKATSINLAGGYQISGPLKLTLGYRHYKKRLASGAADFRSHFYWGGLAYQATPTVLLTASVFAQDVRNMAQGEAGDPIMVALNAKYALSKRTILYVSSAYARTRNNNLVSVSPYQDGFSSSQTRVAGGMQHWF